MQECIQELPRRPTRTGKELPVTERPLEETGLPVGKGLNMQSMAKRILTSGIKMTWEISQNLPSLESWKPNVIEEIISGQRGADKMRPERKRMKPRCLR